jgi:hypothetical protein
MVKMLDRSIRRALRLLAPMSVALALSVGPAGAQRKAGVGTWGFVSVRYDTRSPAYIYTGYGWHAVFLMGAVLRNPLTGNADLVEGVGVVVRTGAAEHWLAVATGGAGARSAAQVYWLPTWRTGTITSRATVKLTLPYDGRAARKLSVGPLAITRRVAGPLAAGAVLEMAALEREITRFATGLELRCKLPGAALGVDALRDVSGTARQARLFFSSTF